jgi:hypothetical protein
MSNAPLQEYLARCHCGAVAARYHTAVPVAGWGVRACQCSFCRAHDALSTSDPAGRLEFYCSRPECLQRYRFGTHMTEFLICRECGVYVGARLAGEPFGIINARALVPIPSDLPVPRPMDYAAESAAQKRARRAQRWTPLVPSSL